jgi:hypothetical protein
MINRIAAETAPFETMYNSPFIDDLRAKERAEASAKPTIRVVGQTRATTKKALQDWQIRHLQQLQEMHPADY